MKEAEANIISAFIREEFVLGTLNQRIILAGNSILTTLLPYNTTQSCGNIGHYAAAQWPEFSAFFSIPLSFSLHGVTPMKFLVPNSRVAE